LSEDELNALINDPHTFRGHNYILDEHSRQGNAIWKCSGKDTSGHDCLSQLVIYKENHFRRTALHTCGAMDTSKQVYVCEYESGYFYFYN
jgi:hypothetical protein